MTRKPTAWYCANKSCSNILGHVTNNELAVDLNGAVLTVNTDGTALAVTCNKCGNLKMWYPSLESAVLGATAAYRRDLVSAIIASLKK